LTVQFTVNDRVFTRLENHELDVIVQVRKLGEGFDHPYLSVAAVFSIFSNLSPFVQFVGRIMRVIVQNSPGHLLNQGTVVFHSGANIARRWEDFQQYSEADREYFDQLLPLEGLDFSSTSDIGITPGNPRDPNTVEVRSQSSVTLEEIPLIEDPVAMSAIQTLRDRGYSPEAVRQAMELQPVPTTKVRERQAARTGLDMRVKTAVSRVLGERGINPQGYALDRAHRSRSNFVVLKAAIDQQISRALGRGSGKRHELTRAEYETIDQRFNELVDSAVKGILDA
jgi:superfamily II DNA or RNA helicase